MLTRLKINREKGTLVMSKLPEIWLERLESLDIAFQPILNIHSGKIFAVEALLRNFRDIGFKSIFELFDTVYKENILYARFY